VPGTIERIPLTIGKAKVRLGYSVPTKYGRTDVDTAEFGSRPVHLLGGSPLAQYRLRGAMNVVSCDWNYVQARAGVNQFFTAGKVIAINKHFPQLKESVFGDVKQDTNYLAFELSCMNIRALWTGCEVAIRFAVEDDLPRIKQIANGYGKELGYVMLPALRESIQRRTLLVAESLDVVAGGSTSEYDVTVSRNHIVGFCNYRACKDGWQTVYEIAVDKTRRGERIGSGLLAAVPNPVRLKCTVDNSANDFYADQGFICAGTEDGRKRRLNIWHRV
jgi:hypothetical protein